MIPGAGRIRSGRFDQAVCEYWFKAVCEDWFKIVAFAYLKNQPALSILIGR